MGDRGFIDVGARAQSFANALQQLDPGPAQPFVALCTSRSDGPSRMLETWSKIRRMRLCRCRLDIRACHPAETRPGVFDGVSTPHSPSPESGLDVQCAVAVGKSGNKALGLSPQSTRLRCDVEHVCWCSNGTGAAEFELPRRGLILGAVGSGSSIELLPTRSPPHAQSTRTQ